MAGLLEAVVENSKRLERECGAKSRSVTEMSRRWAEALKAGVVLFYGHQEVKVGHKDIDWTGSHVHHQEWPAQLNRFFWLEHLAAVYGETGDEELPAIARATIEDWIDQHDYTADAPPAKGDNTLNISIRMGQGVQPGWWGTVAGFAGSPHYDEAFLQRMLASSRGQLACLAAHLTARGNWRISHLDCLLYCGLLVPGLEEHVPFAVRHLNEAFYRQIHPDGSHEEHNPSYHGWMCRLYTRLWRLAQARPEIGLRMDTERAARMWDYAVCTSAPDGGSCGLHDGGVWRPGRGRIGDVDERDAFLREAGLSGQDVWDLEKRPSRYFSSAGQVFLRDNWSPEATLLVFDATRWGGGHCHLSRMGVSLYAHGRMLLCDPGVFSYEMSDPFAPYGKSTPAHSTISLSGLNQTEADPDTRKVHVEDDLAVVASCYAGGYFPGEYTWGWREGKGAGVYGIHERVLLWLKGRGALVLDTLHCDGKGQPYAAHWQFPVGAMHLDAGGGRAWTGGSEANVLVQCLYSRDDLDFVVHEGERDPILGWLPGAKRQARPAPLFAMEGKARGPVTGLATLLLPFVGETPPTVGIERFDGSARGTLGFRFSWPDGTEDIVACTAGLHTQVDRSGPVESDGSMTVVSLANGKPVRAFLCDGMFVEYEGERLIDERVSGTYYSK